MDVCGKDFRAGRSDSVDGIPISTRKTFVGSSIENSIAALDHIADHGEVIDTADKRKGIDHGLGAGSTDPVEAPGNVAGAKWRRAVEITVTAQDQAGHGNVAILGGHSETVEYRFLPGEGDFEYRPGADSLADDDACAAVKRRSVKTAVATLDQAADGIRAIGAPGNPARAGKRVQGFDRCCTLDRNTIYASSADISGAVGDSADLRGKLGLCLHRDGISGSGGNGLRECGSTVRRDRQITAAIELEHEAGSRQSGHRHPDGVHCHAAYSDSGVAGADHPRAVAHRTDLLRR